MRHDDREWPLAELSRHGRKHAERDEDRASKNRPSPPPMREHSDARLSTEPSVCTNEAEVRAEGSSRTGFAQWLGVPASVFDTSPSLSDGDEDDGAAGDISRA